MIDRIAELEKKIKNKQYDGIGCMCAAYGESECGCDADWTSLMELEFELKALRLDKENLKLIAEVANLRGGLKHIKTSEAIKIHTQTDELPEDLEKEDLTSAYIIADELLSTPNKKAEDFIQQVRKETASEIVELMNNNKITPNTYGGPYAYDLYVIINGKIDDNNLVIKQRYNLEDKNE